MLSVRKGKKIANIAHLEFFNEGEFYTAFYQNNLYDCPKDVYASDSENYKKIFDSENIFIMLENVPLLSQKSGNSFQINVVFPSQLYLLYRLQYS